VGSRQFLLISNGQLAITNFVFEFDFLNPEPRTRNPEPGTQNPEPGTLNLHGQFFAINKDPLAIFAFVFEF